MLIMYIFNCCINLLKNIIWDLSADVCVISILEQKHFTFSVIPQQKHTEIITSFDNMNCKISAKCGENTSKESEPYLNVYCVSRVSTRVGTNVLTSNCELTSLWQNLCECVVDLIRLTALCSLISSRAPMWHITESFAS